MVGNTFLLFLFVNLLAYCVFILILADILGFFLLKRVLVLENFYRTLVAGLAFYVCERSFLTDILYIL